MCPEVTRADSIRTRSSGSFFMPSPSILIFAGSTRQGSYNARLADLAAGVAREAGVQVTRLNLAEYPLPLYNADLEARGTPAGALALKALFHEHQGWIICSPEYNASFSGLLKNTIDWVSSPVPSDPCWSDGLKPFAGKVVGLLSASPGALGGLRSLDPLQALLSNLQCWVAPRRHALAHAHEAFTETGGLARSRDVHALQDVVQQVVWASSRLSGLGAL